MDTFFPGNSSSHPSLNQGLASLVCTKHEKMKSVTKIMDAMLINRIKKVKNKQNHLVKFNQHGDHEKLD